MGILLSDVELSQTEPAERAAFHSPVPTQVVSNGEYNPLPQTADQRRVEARIKELADAQARRLGTDRRALWMRSSARYTYLPTLKSSVQPMLCLHPSAPRET